jgi:hypothetical protein
MYSILYFPENNFRISKYFQFLDVQVNGFLQSLTRASYSTVLLVHSNSSLQDRKFCFPFGSMRMHPTPDPSCDLDPSKYMSKLVRGLVTSSCLVIFSPSYSLSTFPTEDPDGRSYFLPRLPLDLLEKSFQSFE